MGLDGKYIGDGYPLCADLPKKHFLKAGAEYRLVNANGRPELQIDPSAWKSGHIVRLRADPAGELYGSLCGSNPDGKCKYAPVVKLPRNLDCKGVECNLDTVRTIQVEAGVFYEYVRPACVEQAFYNDAVRIVPQDSRRGQVMCADPRTEAANSACCDTRRKCCTTIEKDGFLTYVARASGQNYWGERMTYETAQGRCSKESKGLCASPNMNTFCYNEHGGCSNDRWVATHYWTSASCTVLAKVDPRDGTVAIVHSTANFADSLMAKHVQENTKTFFRVSWGDTPTTTVASEIERACRASSDGAFLCPLTVSESQVFTDTAPAISTADVLGSLHIGGFVSGLAAEPGLSVRTTTNNGVAVHHGTSNVYSKDSIVEVTDEFGVKHFRKNVKSIVSVVGTSLSFRNPVHFINLADDEPRDVHYETQAALDSYFYHPNTAPFLAIRFAQRFGQSNPSPRYISIIASAFRSGTYSSSGMSFGSGTYGDLGAMIAAVLLDRESRSVSLDVIPGYGALIEPLLKVIKLMRSLSFVPSPTKRMVGFRNSLQPLVGQDVHQIPTVFSYFLPEYVPSGTRAGNAGLTSPEAQVLTTPTILSSINGIFSLIRFGLDRCWGGLGVGGNSRRCDEKKNDGKLKFVPSNNSTSSAQIVDELATLMTSGRLSSENRAIARSVYEGVDPAVADPILATQQVIASSAEFHSTGRITKSGAPRPKTPKQQSAEQGDYKAVVYIILAGGYDSYNMLVPHSCTGKNSAGVDVRTQYESERGVLAFTNGERKLVVDVNKTKQALQQPCEQFVVHDELRLLHELYEAGDLAFFANAGVLNKPVTKKNFNKQTKTNLFAHNSMQKEAQRIDPYDKKPDTGVLGRILDVMANKDVPGSGGMKYTTGGFSIDNPSVSVRGVPGASPDSSIVSRVGPELFNPGAKAGDVWDLRHQVEDTNNATDVGGSSVYGELWSHGLLKAIEESENLKELLDGAQLKTKPKGTESWDGTISMISRLIQTRTARQSNRDVMFANLGGWDHHSQMKNNIRLKFSSLNRALSSFVDEMKALGVWNDVTLVVTSDFGRTLTPNSGAGSDHAWAGNYFMMGGDVDGGQIHGQYPFDITADSPLNIGRGRGRMIPTLSWDSIFNGIAEWCGLEGETELNSCLPNRLTTGTKMLTRSDLFKVSTTEALSASPSWSPSTNPSSGPSLKFSEIPSKTPSGFPSTQPSLSIAPSWSRALACGENESLILSSSGGTIGIAKSQAVCVLNKVTGPQNAAGGRFLIEASSASFAPVARSYEGNDWEAAAGFHGSIAITCDDSTSICELRLPPLKNGESYQLQGLAAHLYSERDQVARFLEKATFGASPADIDKIATNSRIVSWVRDQMSENTTPATYHRVFYRSYLNARFETPDQHGIVTHPCQKGTKYRMYTFSEKDSNRFVELITIGSKRVVKIGGNIRTVVLSVKTVDGLDYPDGHHKVCRRPDNPHIDDSSEKNSKVELQHPVSGCKAVHFNGRYGNPRLRFDPSIGAPPNHLIDLSGSEAILQPHMPELYGGQSYSPAVQEIMLMSDLELDQCKSFGITGNPEDPVFATYKGEVWIHDPRFVVFDNTVEAPKFDAGGTIATATKVRNKIEFVAKKSGIKSIESAYRISQSLICRVTSSKACRPNVSMLLVPS